MSVEKDAALAALLTLLAFVPTVSGIGAELGDLPKRPADALAMVLTVALTLPLVLRTRRPATCLAIVGTAFALHQTIAYPPTFATVGIYLALYAAGAHQAEAPPGHPGGGDRRVISPWRSSCTNWAHPGRSPTTSRSPWSWR